METPINKTELIEESVQDWLHHEDVSLNDCIDVNIEFMFLNHQHVPDISNKEIDDLEEKYSEQII
jgi:hypothetical protein